MGTGLPTKGDETSPIRRALLTDTSLSMVAVGLTVGLLFPVTSPMLGVPHEAVGRRFVVGCVLAGVFIGAVDALLVRRLVGPRLRELADQLGAVTGAVRSNAFGDAWKPGQLRRLYLPVTSPDDIGRAATAVNELIDALETEHGFRSVIDSSGDLVVMVDGDGVVTFVSDSLTGTLGWEPSEVRGRVLAAFVHAGDLELLMALIDAQRSTVDDEGDRPRMRLRTADGGWRSLEWAVSVRRHDNLGTVLLTGRDVTDQMRLESELVRQATHDTLTGLPNRAALMQIAAEAVAASTAQRPVSVLMIDLDRFKVINDSLGHAVGDQLLAQVGPRLRSILRPSDTIARLGGDEFAVLLPTAGAENARMVADRLAEQLVDPFLVEGMDLHVDASIGIAVSHVSGHEELATVETLLRDADIAMYRAKESRGGIVLFDPVRDTQSSSRLELSAELRRALVDSQLVLHYQPVVDMTQGRVAGVEALVRWRHPERGMVPPGDFLPLAEESGLIVPMSEAVLAMAISQVARWTAGGYQIPVSVNLSPRWLQTTDVPDVVDRMLAEHGVPARLLRLELTENVVLSDPEETLPKLLRLREMGVGLSLDDFGTGYSSMTHLRRLPVDELKVDRGFVQAMASVPQDAVIVRAAIELGHNLGMSVVAEGVEDADTLAEVVAAGCTLAQGFFFAQPLPADELEAWVDERFPGCRAPAGVAATL